MNVIKVKFNIDIDNEQQLKSFNAFITALKSANGESPIIEAPVKDIKQKTTPSANVVEHKHPEPAQQTATQTQEAPEGVSKKLFAIRQLIAKNAGEHRASMIEKLQSYGVESATDLPVDKYNEFHEFLESL